MSDDADYYHSRSRLPFYCLPDVQIPPGQADLRSVDCAKSPGSREYARKGKRIGKGMTAVHSVQESIVAA